MNTFTDFHSTASALPTPEKIRRARLMRDTMLDDVPEDPHWEDFGTASSLRPWGWST